MNSGLRLARIQDVNFLYNIQKNSYKFWWTVEQWKKHLSSNSLVTGVIEENFIVVGYMMFKPTQDEDIIISIAVSPNHRRKGYARILVNDLKKSCSHPIKASVNEYNLGAQLFFKAQGFRAELPIEYNPKTQCNEYLMVFNGRN